MTREDAIEILLDMANELQLIPESKQGQAFKMAIKALEQEPYENVINQPTVVKFEDTNMACMGGDEIMKEFENNTKNGYLSQALEQEPKTGHWVMPVQDDGMSDPIYYQVRCSECGFDLDPQTWHMELHQYGADKYCPNCGAKMKVGE